MGRKSISNVVAGGLITGATVMGVDLGLNVAHAIPMVAIQDTDFEAAFSNNALTCCYDLTGRQEFVFDGFDPSLGDLLTADIGITFDGLASQGLTCCYDINDVVSFGGSVAGIDLTEAFVRDLADGMASVAFDTAGIGAARQTISIDFNIQFRDGVAPFIPAPQGALALSYTYEPFAVPSPGTFALVAPWVIAPLAGALRRRLKDQ